QLRERVQFGDPLAISNRFGKGRVVAMLTAIGMAPGVTEEMWNDWPGGPGAPTFVIMMQLLQKYLTSAGDEGSLAVGAELESDLKRTGREALERSATDRAALTGTVALHGPDNPPIEKEKKTDLSESPWFYLLILGVLVIEQALAVHLSFHLKGGEAPVTAAT